MDGVMFKSKMPLALIKIGEYQFELAPNAFAMGVKVTEDGEMFFNGQFNTKESIK